MKHAKSKERKVVVVMQYISIYLMLLLGNGFFFHSQGGLYEAAKILISVVMLFVLGVKKIHKRITVVCALEISVMLLSSTLNGDGVKTIIVILSDFLVAYLIAISCSRAESMKRLLFRFENLMYYLCIGSVVLYLLSVISNGMFAVFPAFRDNAYTGYFTGISFVIKARQYVNLRNFGLFWEPGAFQTFIIAALLIEMFLKAQVSWKRLAVYSVTMVTTMSTTGILVTALLWAVYAFSQKKKWQGILLSVAIVIVVVVVYLNPAILPDELQFALFEKLGSLLSSGTSDNFTTSVRIDSVVYPLQEFFKSPIIGVGRSGLTALRTITGHSMNTCTPVNWLAHYGMFMFAMIFWGYVRFTRLFSSRWSVRLLIVAVFMLSISSEAYNYEPTLLCISLLGYAVPGGLRKGKKRKALRAKGQMV